MSMCTHLQGSSEERRKIVAVWLLLCCTSISSADAADEPQASTKGERSDETVPVTANRAQTVEREPQTAPGKGKKLLHGRVEDMNKTRLERPVESVINQSVEIMDGGAYGGFLDGRAEDAELRSGTAQDVLKSMVGAGDFKMGYKKREAQSDPGPLREWEADMDSKKFQWQSVQYSIPEYRLPGLRPVQYNLRKFSIPGRYYQTDDWTIRQRGVQGEVRFPSAGGQLFADPTPHYTVPQYTIPDRFQPANEVAPMNSNFQQDGEQLVEWNSWYKRVANLLWTTWRTRGSASGEADLKITVDRQQHLQCEVLAVTNRAPAFKDSLLKAVQAVNGAPALVFPAQSKRQSVTFQSHFSAGVDIKSGAVSKRNNDTERVRVPAKRSHQGVR